MHTDLRKHGHTGLAGPVPSRASAEPGQCRAGPGSSAVEMIATPNGRRQPVLRLVDNCCRLCEDDYRWVTEQLVAIANKHCPGRSVYSNASVKARQA